MNAALAAYRELIDRIVDLEPMSGFVNADSLPKLERVDVAVVFAHDASDVIGALDLSEVDTVRALASSNPIGGLGVIYDKALERAARSAIWHDVLTECERRDELLRDDEERVHESEESRRGVVTAFRGSHLG